MYCSSGEPSQVEHYRPASVFPELTFTFENYLWSCDICNKAKGARFPPATENGAQILNPIDDNVWEHFYIDETTGELTKRKDPETKTDFPRAVSTCDIVGIDRELVQSKRRNLFKFMTKKLRKSNEDFQNARITKVDLEEDIVELRDFHFQRDVTEYFLNGPGRVYEPFKSALSAIGEEISK